MSDVTKQPEVETKSDEKAAEVEINVDSATYLTLQLAKMDDEIASLELSKAQIDLKISQCKKNKMQAIMDFHYSELKAQTDKKAAENKEKA
jgi:hypothetical protein